MLRQIDGRKGRIEVQQAVIRGIARGALVGALGRDIGDLLDGIDADGRTVVAVLVQVDRRDGGTVCRVEEHAAARHGVAGAEQFVAVQDHALHVADEGYAPDLLAR